MLWPKGLSGNLDWPSALITIAATVALFRFKRGVIQVMMACALVGLVVHLLRSRTSGLTVFGGHWARQITQPTELGKRCSMRWITRERPKIDRIACPWLIARFIDPPPEFLYVPSGDVLRLAAEKDAAPYDIPGVELTHEGELCSFDAF